MKLFLFVSFPPITPTLIFDDLLQQTFITCRIFLTLELVFQSYALICLEINIDNACISNCFFFNETQDC